ncbi:GGDEF domain-containing protein [Pontibacillus salicampi]|uniref:GGDEF domain-containing protein n=1 Tax=Pontibacillus salicampi TaxID=1449801 RepID=A0ABV6LPR3_9BACI
MLTYIGEIAEAVPCIDRKTISADVSNIFEQDNYLEGVVVGNDKNIFGLMMKFKFHQKIAAKFGYDLFMGRPIELIMDRSPLIVDYFDFITDVSSKAMKRTQEHLYDYVIVTKDRSFFGIVSIKDLLQTFAETQTYLARFSNPLTGLPGNLFIEEKLEDALALPAYSILYFDINHFKAYNDSYGFKKGDLVIRETASIIQDGLYSLCSDYFLGHIGGDDFIGIVYNHEYKQVCEHIMETFDENVRHLYSDQDWNNGYVYVYDRNKQMSKSPLLSIAIAIVTNKDTDFESTNELSEFASHLKTTCKLEEGSHFASNITLLPNHNPQ